MANRNLPNGFRAVEMLGGGQTFPHVPAKLGSNISLNPGDAVFMLTTGKLRLALVSDTQIFPVCDSKVLGAVGVEPEILVIPALPNIVFEAQYGTTATTLNNVGASHDIGGATGVQVLSSTSAGGAPARLLGLSPAVDNALGQYMRVRFVWQKSQFTGQA